MPHLSDIMKRKLSRRERVLAVAAIAFVVIGVVYAAALEPVLLQWRQLSARLEGRYLTLVRNERLAEAAGDIEQSFNEAFGASLSIEEAVNSLMEDVRARGQGTVKVTGMQPASPTSSPGLQVAKTQVEFEGTMSQTMAFLYSVEKESGGLWIERCQISPAGTGSNLLRGTAVACKAIIGTQLEVGKP